ncbi:hypothetical protein AKJ09_07166 [Labilithrix luteola]|uniref:Uncharacterized protein n=1 Tax=Labilithrix luteola TaxID=1391654 RepID=A0A0K1Q428_9BACT|nr:hypothetical protein [Labilithrix luteola]AKV00503.1 hypothetical protein AKJ09_07166 [Labilithrix luteola]
MPTPYDRTTRRTFLDRLARATGALVLAPISSACAARAAEPSKPGDPRAVPRERPAGWDPIEFNRARGNAGAIPASYLPSINGPDGDAKHLGKHLPYIPNFERARFPAGAIALMWGDSSKGYAAHPNAAPSQANPEGHWFNWIRIRKAVAGDAEERESRFSAWPHPRPGDNGAYRASRGDAPGADSGKDTIYIAELPSDVRPGDLVRIHAHCITHGEYVDFLVVPS